MAEPQDQPGSEPNDVPAPPAGEAPPAQPAKKVPAAKAPAKKAPAKKAPAKKAPAKKVPAKKAPAKKAPVKSPEPTAATPEQPPAPRPETNGHIAAAAKDAAAQAKSTVEKASNPVSHQPALPTPGRSPVPLVIAAAVSLLAILLVRQLRR